MNLTDSLSYENRFDAVLIGAGIMSATLAVLLHELEPDMRILIVERLDAPALESSSALNNAGTGHAANCEFNYTPCLSDGSIDISKALNINASFERSLELWASLVEMGRIYPERFINFLPHISFVWKEDDINFLRKRFIKLSAFNAFKDMEWSDDKTQINEWIPLIMDGRDSSQNIAATRVARGTDIDFGSLTSAYLETLKTSGAVEVSLSTNVIDLNQDNDKLWRISCVNYKRNFNVKTPFVFLGAGGGALSLLHKSGVSEGKKYGGFPVSGQWLICNNPNITSKHNAKVYGKSAIGAPPMSVPHLDTRWIAGEKSLLFGPFAGFNTKFLKNGSSLDFFRSIKLGNISPMVQAGIKNVDLIKYLLSQIQLNQSSRVKSLKDFFPKAKSEDWMLSVAGQRVQIIKQTSEGGMLKLGTEVVASRDGSIAALLGASPGASTAVSIMLEVLERCWSEKMSTNRWKERLLKLMPSLDKDINSDKPLLDKIRLRSNYLLGLR